jgi:Alcohol dehydrogenase GroES-like domain
MKAAVVHAFTQPPSIENVPKPEPSNGQVLVRIKACGLCHADIHAAHGDWPIKPPLPLIPGHEGLGIVEALGPDAPSRRTEQTPEPKEQKCRPRRESLLHRATVTALCRRQLKPRDTAAFRPHCRSQLLVALADSGAIQQALAKVGEGLRPLADDRLGPRAVSKPRKRPDNRFRPRVSSSTAARRAAARAAKQQPGRRRPWASGCRSRTEAVTSCGLFEGATRCRSWCSAAAGAALLARLLADSQQTR